MRAFVLGGGSNLGPMQVGALQALFEKKIFPDVLIGCSVGSLNAAFVAQGFYGENLQKLADLWGEIRREDIYPGSKVETLARLLLGRQGLSSNRHYRSWLMEHGLDHDQEFSQMPIPLYITATNCYTNRLHTFGKRKGDRVLDAIMASTAVPPLHAPWQIGSESYIDGSTITPFPLRVALELGATEIYGLRVEHYQPQVGEQGFNSGSIGVVQRSINTMIRTQAEHDLHLAKTAKNVKLIQIELRGPKSLARHDFSHGTKLVERGYQLARASLSSKSAGSLANISAKVEETGYAQSTFRQEWGITMQHVQSKLQQTVTGKAQTV